MRNRAINALIEMGMSASLRGFYYIADVMELYITKEKTII